MAEMSGEEMADGVSSYPPCALEMLVPASRKEPGSLRAELTFPFSSF